jgi:hypothetical protein
VGKVEGIEGGVALGSGLEPPEDPASPLPVELLIFPLHLFHRFRPPPEGEPALRHHLYWGRGRHHCSSRLPVRLCRRC